MAQDTICGKTKYINVENGSYVIIVRQSDVAKVFGFRLKPKGASAEEATIEAFHYSLGKGV